MDNRGRCRTLFRWFILLTFFHNVLSQEDLCRPAFGYEKFTIIDEDTQTGTVILTLNTVGSSQQVNLTMEDNDNFDFSPATQELSVKRQLDADSEGSTTDTLKIACQETNKQPVEISVMVTIKDINDNPPVFELPHFYVDVPETMSVDQTFDSKVKATDADASFKNYAVYYTVQEGEFSDYFQFPVALSPFLVLRKALDFETLPNMTITVVATNQMSSDKLNSTALLTIRVTDEDDLNPVFSTPQYYGWVLETAEINSLVNVTPAIYATDADITLNDPVTYSFHDQFYLCERDARSSQKVFTIDNETAQVRVVGAVSPSKVSVVIQATQKNNPSRYGVAMLVITVVGVNSNAPKFQSDLYQTFVSEATPPDTVILFVSATDQDFGSSIHYDIVEDNTPFAMDPESGAISLKSALDFETSQFYILAVRASDGNMESTATVEVTVVDVNDNAPVIVNEKLSFDIDRENMSIVTTIQAHDADADSVLSFRLANYISLFSIDTSGNLRISAEPSELTNVQYQLVIIVSDNGTAPHETAVLATVNFPTPPTSPPLTSTETTTTKPTTALPVAMSGVSGDILTIVLGVLAAVLLVVVVVLVIFLCRRRNQTKEHLDKAKVNRSPDPRGLKFKEASRASRPGHMRFPGDDSMDGTTTVQENPLSFKEADGAFNPAFVYPGDRENDHHLDEIHIETAVIPYQAADAFNNNNNHHHHHPLHTAGRPSEMYQHDDSSECGDTLPTHKHAHMYPDNTSSESLNTSLTNSSGEGGAKQMLIGNGVTSFGTTSFGKNAAPAGMGVGGGGGGSGGLDSTPPATSMEGLNPDVSVTKQQEQKSELTVYF